MIPAACATPTRPALATAALIVVALLAAPAADSGPAIAGSAPGGPTSPRGNAPTGIPAPSGPTPAEQRIAATEFSAMDLDGKEVKLSDYRGKVVILDFWATWCPPCRKGIPELMELQTELQKEGLEVVGLSLDQKGVAVVKPFVEKNGINYTMLIASQSVAQAYVPTGRIPTMHIVDRKGRIAQTIVGLVPKETIAGIVKKLIAEG